MLLNGFFAFPAQISAFPHFLHVEPTVRPNGNALIKLASEPDLPPPKLRVNIFTKSQ